MIDGIAPAVRTLAGRYQVGELLGRGGMADVHLGTDARLGRRVAIKLLKPSLANDPAFRLRFRQEAQAAARMAHPTIVRVYDAGEETVRDANGLELQVPFIVMEYVQGRLLKDMIAQGPLDPAEAVRIVEGVLTALEYSHRAGVVHRDIKPGNIMVTPTGQVKVMDFGIARAISDSAATVAQTSAILGTALYFSPEQARGEPVDARTDLYSTGVVLFEMLTGRPPFQGATPVAVAYQHVSEAPVAPSTINPKVSPAIDAVTLHALAKDRFERFQSAAEFRDDAAVAAAGEVPTRKVPTVDAGASLFGANPARAAGAEAAVRQLTVDQDERVVRTQNRPPVAWIWAGITSMAVVIIAVVFWVFNLTSPQLEPAESIQVPDLAGQPYEQAVATLEGEGLVPQRLSESSPTVPAESVIRTDPTGGSDERVSPGQTIRVYVSSGPELLPIPAIGGLAAADAQAALEQAGFALGEVRDSSSVDVPAGAVIGAEPVDVQAVGNQAPRGTVFNLVVSTGNVDVPDVTGQPTADASTALSALRLQVNVSLDRGCSGGTVSGQSLPPGPHPQGSEITLRVCAA